MESKIKDTAWTRIEDGFPEVDGWFVCVTTTMFGLGFNHTQRRLLYYMNEYKGFVDKPGDEAVTAWVPVPPLDVEGALI